MAFDFGDEMGQQLLDFFVRNLQSCLSEKARNALAGRLKDGYQKRIDELEGELSKKKDGQDLGYTTLRFTAADYNDDLDEAAAARDALVTAAKELGIDVEATDAADGTPCVTFRTADAPAMQMALEKCKENVEKANEEVARIQEGIARKKLAKDPVRSAALLAQRKAEAAASAGEGAVSLSADELDNVAMSDRAGALETVAAQLALAGVPCTRPAAADGAHGRIDVNVNGANAAAAAGTLAALARTREAAIRESVAQRAVSKQVSESVSDKVASAAARARDRVSAKLGIAGTVKGSTHIGDTRDLFPAASAAVTAEFPKASEAVEAARAKAPAGAATEPPAPVDFDAELTAAVTDSAGLAAGPVRDDALRRYDKCQGYLTMSAARDLTRNETSAVVSLGERGELDPVGYAVFRDAASRGDATTAALPMLSRPMRASLGIEQAQPLTKKQLAEARKDISEALEYSGLGPQDPVRARLEQAAANLTSSAGQAHAYSLLSAIELEADLAAARDEVLGTAGEGPRSGSDDRTRSDRSHEEPAPAEPETKPATAPERGLSRGEVDYLAALNEKGALDAEAYERFRAKADAGTATPADAREAFASAKDPAALKPSLASRIAAGRESKAARADTEAKMKNGQKIEQHVGEAARAHIKAPGVAEASR